MKNLTTEQLYMLFTCVVIGSFALGVFVAYMIDKNQDK